MTRVRRQMKLVSVVKAMSIIDEAPIVLTAIRSGCCQSRQSGR
jgi:hypothetical protein